MKYQILLITILFGCSPDKKSFEVATGPSNNNVLTKDSLPTDIAKKAWDSTLTYEIVNMSETDQKYRSESVEHFERNHLLQSTIDSLNTYRLIEIIRTYGFPTAERLKKKANVTIILMHSPESFFPTLKKLIDQEYKLKNIPQYEYELLTWHLGGRVGQGP
jgi:hypothetical protein